MTKQKPNIAILGATGVVGREITKIVDELGIEFNSIKFLSSSKSAGTKLSFQGKEYTVEEAKPESFDGVNIVLASAGASTSKLFAPEIVKRGGVLIDNSSAFRMEPDVPLVIAYVNDEDLKKHKGIISNPNCSTSQLMLVLKPLNDKFKIKRLLVSTYQAVSGAGLKAINELRENTKAALNGEKFEPKAFKKEIAFNVIPQIDNFCENGYTKEEMKVVNETKKILHLAPDLPISCTAARVPVFNSHSEAVDIEFEQKVTPEQIREILNNSFGVKVIDNIDNFEYPTTKDSSGVDPVFVGRIRKNLAFDNGISLWCVADNLRIGAALNTVRICKKVIEMGLY
ncbi:MAG TPA: aspartate-semialdehyde dehydrogenase [Cyanobacteria bacterium UBA11991]|nr:aspartate-semialdehyde dehydrogenase [Cyanobacteriota bacterium]MDY6359496.1 aspartate-semialdehyde dehydrogenase [Cyanobacteriota bacterium]MDY6364794.1 aspartate-semialdehyde dehydrogenase [Cyanobacteriota bacterium]MDY6383806.1 aspartate-semialdehyde dehydrogenase [Cyanobacteriota bacterium]HCB10682.1 aspartate-semialdehyde dehydrogenase [Cyanobacteria bacterium UBA11991]